MMSASSSNKAASPQPRLRMPTVNKSSNGTPQINQNASRSVENKIKTSPGTPKISQNNSSRGSERKTKSSTEAPQRPPLEHSLPLDLLDCQEVDADFSLDDLPREKSIAHVEILCAPKQRGGCFVIQIG